MDDKRKYHFDYHKTPQKKPPYQKLQTHNVPTDYVENTDSTNLRFAY